MYFNPRSPCRERPPLRLSMSVSYRDFNPRSPCRERLLGALVSSQVQQISIHAPHVGSDTPKKRRKIVIGKFQSTLPM